MSWFLQQKLCSSEGSGKIYLKWWKGKAYNQEHGITPTSVKKKIDEGLRAIIPQKETDKKKIIDIKKVPKDEYSRLIKELSAQMDMASANLEFEKAAELRDLIADIRSQL